ncbi:MAG: DinB family protein [Cyclobacteriaceae bacterium]
MEDKKFIEQQLVTNTEAFTRFVSAQSEQQFVNTPNGKWSVGQNLEHLIRSLVPVNQALLLPGFVLRMLFGKPNRKPRTYQELIDRYNQKLAAGGRASGRFVPPAIAWIDRDKKIAALNSEKEKMIVRLSSWSESKLDTCLLPHPLLGKLTLREMLFFSVYHIQHHKKLLEGRV